MDAATTSPTALKMGLQGKLPEMLGMLERLVNIDSGSYCKSGVDRVGRFLAEQLSALGFEIDIRRLADRGDQVIGNKRFGGAGRLLILGHADTVWPEGTVRDWPYSRRDERATGPGVGDMKGGLVMALFALRELFERRFDRLEWIRFFIVPDEELGSVNSRRQIEEAAKDANWTLVLEPGRPGGGIVTARGAVGAFFMRTHGHTAHCAVNYHKGASAVRELAFKVPELERLSDPDNGNVVNVGVFRGGAARQVVPDEAEIHIDLRAPTQQRADALVAEFRRITSANRDPRVRSELLGQLTRPAFARERSEQLYGVASEIAKELGIPLHDVSTAGGSDGNFAAAFGIPTLDGLGPICHDVCARGESIEIPSLATRGAMFAAIIHRLSHL
jgi:glutamate carboxypeptidase